MHHCLFLADYQLLSKYSLIKIIFFTGYIVLVVCMCANIELVICADSLMVLISI